MTPFARLALGACLLLSACSGTGSEVAGTGSQTGNTVVSGIALGADSLPAAYALVRLRPLSWTDSLGAYLASDRSCVRDTVTDSLGRYVFTGLDSGAYRIEIRKDSLAAFVGVRLHPERPAATLSASLSSMASLAGEIHLTDSTRSGRLEVYGLQRSIALPDTGREIHFRIDSLPAGRFTVRLWSPRLQRAVLEIPVQLQPGQMVLINDEQWDRHPEGPSETE